MSILSKITVFRSEDGHYFRGGVGGSRPRRRMLESRDRRPGRRRSSDSCSQINCCALRSAARHFFSAQHLSLRCSLSSPSPLNKRNAEEATILHLGIDCKAEQQNNLKSTRNLKYNIMYIPAKLVIGLL